MSTAVTRYGHLTSSTHVVAQPCGLVAVIVAQLSDVAAADVNIRDGSDATADVVMPVRCPAGDTRFVSFAGRDRVKLDNGLFVEIESGSAEIAVFYRF